MNDLVKELEYWLRVIGDRQGADRRFNETVNDVIAALRAGAPSTRMPDASKVLLTGRMMANAMYNLSQRGEMTDDIRSQMRIMQQEWDKAAAEYRATATPSTAMTGSDLLKWLDGEKNLELSFQRWEEDTDASWQVHEIRGGRNDQEWSLLGKGDTPERALSAAKIALGVRRDAKASKLSRNGQGGAA